MSKKISTAKIGEEGLVMLLHRNGTIIANRDNLMISESLFVNNLKTKKRDKNEYVPFIIEDKDYIFPFWYDST